MQREEPKHLVLLEQEKLGVQIKELLLFSEHFAEVDALHEQVKPQSLVQLALV